MIDFTKYLFYYLRSHYHYLRLEKARIKSKKLHGAKFQKKVSKFIRHGQKFDMIQVKIDALKNEIIAKHPELKEES